MNKHLQPLSMGVLYTRFCLYGKIKSLLILLLFMFSAFFSQGQKRMEHLGRGLVAIRTNSNQVYVGWRMLGTDPSGIGFNIYRGTTKLNSTVLTTTTDFIDNTTTNESYTVRPVISGVEQPASVSALVSTQAYLSIPLQQPAGGTTPDNVAYTYNANDASVGDLDGDGEYEVVLKWDPSNSKDNAQSGYTGNVILDAYKLNGTRLWRINLGKNIRAGAHYTQFLVYDFDSDGKAELACKTADGTIDGAGITIGSSTADYRNASGYILTGPEYMTVFNGETGAAMATANYLPGRGTVSSWGDGYGNRVDRFTACVAYLDGQRPSMVFGRGYYTRLVRVAWDWRNGQLTQRWTFDSDAAGNSAYYGQGNHQLTVGDLDGDGKDEIINGSSAINDNGTGLYANGLGHGDAMHLSDMDPDRPGQEFWQCHEDPGSYGNYGLEFRDADTGTPLWGIATTGDVGRALAADVDPNYKGYEVWGSAGGLYTCKGVQISAARPSFNFTVWWDADLQRELLDGTKLEKWNYASGTLSRILTLYQAQWGNALENNSSKANPCLTADILGDWREEILMRSSDNQRLLLYTTTTPATNRIYTLMHDPQYRMAIAWQNVAYNQPPHPSFYIGTGMAAPPTPNIVLVTPSASITIQENTTGFCGVDGTIDNNNAGYSGSGFANANNAANTAVNWRVQVPATGTYNLTFRYANGVSADRPARILVNGSTAVNSLSFPATGAWTTWVEVSANVTLSTGTNNISLQSINSTGPANIDYLKVTGNNPQPLACSVAARMAFSPAAENDIEEKPLLQIFPNPSAVSFNIRMNSAFSYQVFNTSGKLVESGSGVNNTTVGAQWPVGFYTIRILQGNQVHTRKLVKQ